MKKNEPKSANWCSSKEHKRYLDQVIKKANAPAYVPRLLTMVDGAAPFFRKYMGMNRFAVDEILHFIKKNYQNYERIKDKNARLIAIHADPKFRVASYFTAYEGVSNNRPPIPSVEFTALSKYDSTFIDNEPADAKFCSKYPELTECLDLEIPPEVWKAVVLWPQLVESLSDWGNFDVSQKEDTAMAIYAVATLAGTTWPITESFKIVPELVDIIAPENVDSIDSKSIHLGTKAIEFACGDDAPDACDDTNRWQILLEQIAVIIQEAKSSEPSSLVVVTLEKLIAECKEISESYSQSEQIIVNLVRRIRGAITEINTVMFASPEEIDVIVKSWEDALRNESIGANDIDSVIDELTGLADNIAFEQKHKEELNEKLSNLSGTTTTAIGRLQMAQEQNNLTAEISAVQGNILNYLHRVHNTLNQFLGADAESESLCQEEHPETLTQEAELEEPAIEETVMEPACTDEFISAMEAVEEEIIQPETTEESSEIFDAESDTNEPEVIEPQVEAQPEKATTDTIVTASSVKTLLDEIDSSDEFLPSADIAVRLIEQNNFTGTLADNLLSALLVEKNFSAAWVASSLAALHGDKPHVHEVLLKTVTLAPHVAYCDGEMASVLCDLISKNKPNLNSLSLDELAVDNQVASLFIIAACLRPALIAPQTEAAARLQSIKLPSDTDGLYNLVQEVNTYSNLHQPLDMHILNNSMTLAAWNEEVEKTKDSASRWLEEAYTYRIKYKPAEKVWRSWLETDGYVQKAVALVVAGDSARLAQIKTELKRLSDSSKNDSEIDKTDDDLRPVRGGTTQNIDYDARRNIHTYTTEACALLRRFITVVENRPGADKKNNFTNKMVDKLRDGFKNYLEPSRTSLAKIIANNRSILGIAAQICLDSVNDVARLFDPRNPIIFFEYPAKHLLYRQSMLTLGWETDAYWCPIFNNPVKAVEDFLVSLADRNVTLENSYECASKRKNHTVTERIIEVMEARGDIDKANAFRSARQADLADCRNKLADDCDNAIRTLDDAFNYGCLTDSNYNEAVGRLSTMKKSIDSITDFAACDHDIEQIQNKIIELSKIVRDRVNEDFNALSLDHDSNAYKLISKKLDEGDYALASEMVKSFAEGSGIHFEESQEVDLFTDFSTRRLPLIEKALEQNKVTANIISILNAGRSIEDNFLALNEGPKAAKIVDAYLTAGRREFTNKAEISNVLSVIGFSVKSLNSTTSSKIFNLKLNAPIIDRSICPIAIYGSRADGEYRVLVLYGNNVLEDQIRSEITAAKEGSAPFIVMVFGVFPEVRRRQLAKMSRERARTFLVLDNTLIYAAATTNNVEPLSAMFKLAVPWTFYKPYSEGGGGIPEEMFYGRETERSEIIGNGETSTAFIYGGRQLGKTALLTSIAKRFHNGTNQIAIYVDLLAIGIGKALPLNNFWSILCKELRAVKVLEENDTPSKDGGKEHDLICNWLDSDPSRRILLFLDEADGFLNEDGKENFKIAGTLRSLKDKTHGRFRVVFSGLHNVKRSTDAKNDPLVQLGNAICIGPMLSAAERRDATRLIEEPMAACGYRFSDRSLIWRIMALSLYSPSLIQIFCSKIMNHINANLPAYDRKGFPSPPYIIEENVITDAYRSQGIRDDIVYRFNKTITLDDRYDVIACIIAYDMMDNPGKRGSYDASWLRASAQKAWPKGFNQYHGSLDAFIVILNEMEGLGVLICDKDDGTYSFRTSSIATLLGSPEEVLDRLLKDRPEPLEYTPAVFRQAAGLRSEPFKRAPLSVIDMGAICSQENGVVLVSGTQAGGLDLLAKSFPAFGHDRIELLSKIAKLSDFEANLADVKKQRSKKAGTTIVYVDSSCRWDDKWIASARGVERGARDVNFIKVLFEADSAKIDYLVKNECEIKLRDNKKDMFRCLPWHRDMVNVWVSDYCTISHEKLIVPLMEATGGWPELLYEFHKAEHDSPRQWKEKLDEICAFEDKARAIKIGSLFGLAANSPHLPFLRILAEWEKASTEDICVLQEGASEQEVNQALNWAYLSGLAEKDDDIFMIDPLVGRIIKALPHEC